MPKFKTTMFQTKKVKATHVPEESCRCTGTASVDCKVPGHADAAILRGSAERGSMSAGHANQKSAVKSGR